MAPWAIGQNSQLMSPYNSDATELNFTKHGCEGSIDIVVIPVALVFQELFLVSVQWPFEEGRVWIFTQKMAWHFEPPKFFGEPNFMGAPPLLNNTTKTSFGEDFVKIRPAVAKQPREKKKKKNTEQPRKCETLPSLVGEQLTQHSTSLLLQAGCCSGRLPPVKHHISTMVC